MKIFFVIVTVLVLNVYYTYCQTDDAIQPELMAHLFHDKPKRVSAFINPAIKFSQVAQQYCFIPEIRVGVIINKKMAIGGLYSFTFPNIVLSESMGGGNLQMKMEGLNLEYTLWPLKKVHLTFPLSVGIGQLKIDNSSSINIAGDPNFLFIEPGIMVEINTWKYAKAGIGLNYRSLNKVSYSTLVTNDLRGFNVVVSVRFGRFNYMGRKMNKRDKIKEEN